jgi:L-threonylcarbamoyladenylate synthase
VFFMNHFSNTPLDEAVQVLHKGGIVALPTEGVYGLSCRPDDLVALKRLCQIKQRPENKGFVLVACDILQLTPYIEPLSEQALAIVENTWPGPVTWVVPVKPEVPTLVHGEKPTIAVRVSSHPILAEACRQLGSAIISTSANLADNPPATSAEQIREIFPHGQIDYILDGPLGGLGRPTEIRDLQSQTILRRR